MTNTVLIKRSGTANSIPTAGNLSAGELAINYNDGNLFYKNTSNVVQLLVSNQFVSVTGNISGGNVAYGSGNVSGTGNISGSNIIATSAISAGSISLSGNVTSALNVSLGIAAGTTIVAVGNITGGNINAAGLSLSGNVVSNLRVTANISGGNITTAGLISATGNITVGNVRTVGIISAAGNIIAGNVNGGANVTATTFNGTTAVISGNVQGGNLNGNAANIVTTAIINSSADLALTPTLEYLVVAGGGGGGAVTGGGGGAGGLLTGNVSISTGTLSVTVGAGGAGGLSAGTTTGTSGSNSVLSGANITTITAVGGGGGGGEGPKSGLNGGSGGGTSINGGNVGVGIYPGSTYISAPRQGYDGGGADGAGGGGAGQTGQGDASGGNGVASSISGTSTYYAGGGGGWGRSGLEPGGLGGGGAGAVDGGAGPVAGTVNTGGGGGGGNISGANANGAAGGSGVVIVRYADTYSAAAGTTGSLSYTVTGGYRIYTFTGNGTITFGGLINSNSPTTGALIVTGGVGIGQDVFTGGNISATGNVNSGNVNTTKVVATSFTGTTVSVTGNVTGNYFVGNGSALTGIIASAGAAITNGNSNVSVAANSNVTVAVTGSTIATFASTGAYVTGIISATGNITGGNVSGINLGGSLTTPAQPNITSVGTLSNVSVSGNVDAGNYLTGGIVSAIGNITGGNLSGANIAGTLTTASQTNITSVGTLGSLSVTGNVTGGNLTTGGAVSATGNVTAGNILGGANVNATTHTGSTVSVTGNVTGGNLVGGNISGTLITAAQTNITSVGTLTALSVTGNVTGGNLTTGSQVSATGNVTGGNLLTGGNVYTPTNNTGLVGGVTVAGQGYVGTFNGSSQRLRVNSTPSSEFAFGTGDYTFEAWIYVVAYPADKGTIVCAHTSGTAINWLFGLDSGGGLYLYANDGNVNTGNGNVPLTTWTHVAISKISGTFTWYINGVSQGTQSPASYNMVNTVPITIGGDNGGDSSQYFNGKISNLRVVKGLGVYTGNFTVPTGPLTATAVANPFGGANTSAITGTATSLLTLQNSTIIDNSSYGFAFTNTGTVTTGLQTVPFGSGVYAGTFLYNGSTWQSTAISVSGNVSATYLIGNGSQLTGIASTYGNANVAANLAAFGSNPISTTGNITGGYILGNGSQLTGIVSSYGNANVAANLAAFGSNPISTTGNITGGYILGNGSQLTDIVSTYGNANVAANLAAFGSNPISTTGNITAGNILGGANVNATTHTGTTMSVTGNVTGNYFIGNGSQLTGIASSYGNANVAANLAAFGSNPISTTGNITSGNILTNGYISATGNITGTNATFTGNLSVAGNVTYIDSNVVTINDVAINLGNNAANITQVNNGGIELGPQGSPYVTFLYNSSANTFTSNVGLSAVANVTGGNILTSGLISATGNVTSNYFIGNGSQLTGIASTYGNANVAANLAAFGSNPISTTGNITGANIVGTIAAGANAITTTGNVTGGNILTGGLISATGNVTGNYFIGNGSQLTGIASSYGNANVAANLAAFGSNPISTSGNITGGNIIGTHVGNVTGTTVSVTGNITAGNILGGANVNATTLTGATVSVTGNITGGNVNATGLSLSGNVVSALVSVANITTTANISGGNVLTNGNVYTPTNNTGLIGGATVAGQAYVGTFNGNYLSIAANSVFDQNGAFTIECWVYPTDVTTTAAIWSQLHTGFLSCGIANTSGKFYVYSPGVGNYIESTSTYTANAWYHVALSCNGTTTILYINGTNQGSYAGTGTTSSTSQPLFIGNYFNGPFSNPWPGYITNFRYAKGIAVYTSAFTPSTNALTATQAVDTNGQPSAAITGVQTSLLTLQNSTIIDNSTFARSITNNGPVTTSLQTVPFGGVYAGSFLYNGTTWQSTSISVSGGVSASYFVGNGSQLTGLAASYGNANVAANLAAFGTNPISTSGNITGGNILGGANVNATTHTGDTVSVTGDITGGNLYTAGAISSTGNSFGGNLSTTGQVISTNTGSTTTGGGQVYLNGAVNNRIDFNTNGTAAPANTTRSTGTKITLYPALGPTAVDYALGVESGALWSSIPGYDAGQFFKWYGGTTQVGSLSGTGVLSIAGNVTGANINATGLSLSGNVVSVLVSAANITTTANVSGGYILGNGSQLTGVVSSYGNANVAANLAAFGSNPISTSGNITSGNLNAAGLSLSGNVVSALNSTAAITTTANVSGGYILGNGSQLTGVVSSYGNANVAANLAAFGSNPISTSGNITGGNINAAGLSLSGNVVSAIVSAANITTTANVSGGYILGNGSQLTGIASSYGNANVAANLAAFGSNPISTTGNITGGNMLFGSGVVSGTGNITGGNLNATGLSLSGNVVSALNSTAAITTTANITAGNILGGANVNATTHTGTTVSVTGNITGGNVNTNTIVGTSTTIRSTGTLNFSATGNIEVNSTYINNLLDPVQNQDAATKAYVDSVAQGLHIHQAANLASTADLATYTGATVTYSNGSSGVGATLSLVGNTLTTLDGTAIPGATSTRLLIKNQGNAVQNGVYNYTSTSLLTRSVGEDTNGELNGGDFLFVLSGVTNADTGWVQSTDNVVIGTSSIVFTQFSGAGTYTANTAAGLVLNGTQFSAKTDNISTTFDGTGNIVVKAGATFTTPNIGAATGTSLSVTGNVTGGNIIGIVAAGANTITTTGNITGGNVLFGSGIISGTGNITSGNVNAAGLSLSSNVVSAINSAANITTTANIAGGNIIGTHVGNVTGTTVSVSGNITGGNILGGANVNAVTHTGATVSVTGNIITGGGIVSRVVPITDATSVTINADTTDLATQTNTQVTGTLTVNAPTGTLANGQKITFRLQSSNVQTFSWNTVFAGSTDLSLPTTSSGSSKYDYMGFIYNSTATKWQLLAKNFGF